VNPKWRIPALLIDGFVLTENPAILAYLGRRFPAAGLYPPDASEAEARCGIGGYVWTRGGSEVPLLLLVLSVAIVLRGGAEYSVDRRLGGKY